ncbi:MAG: hypothetical protein K2G40_08295 [Muribaculaceae bacterium]|nr:hypothetical protein [Muribaculaceae bacterium]
MIYSLNFLIDEWKMRAGLEPARIDSTITRHDALDIDAYIERMINDWYEQLLEDGDLKYLDPEDITDLVTVSTPVNGVSTMILPAGVRHLVEIKDSNWARAARIVFPDSHEARRQESVFSRGGTESPVAVIYNNSEVRLYSFKPGMKPLPERVVAIRHVPGEFRLSPLALSLIPPAQFNF